MDMNREGACEREKVGGREGGRQGEREREREREGDRGGVERERERERGVYIPASLILRAAL